MSEEWEQHRERFASRPETFDAYVEVWTRDLDARRKYADWLTFARCADADLAMVRKAPDLVRQAELILSRNGYRLGAGAGGSSRRWQHTRGEVRTTSERPVHDPAKVRAAKERAAKAGTASPAARTFTGSAAPKSLVWPVAAAYDPSSRGARVMTPPASSSRISPACGCLVARPPLGSPPFDCTVHVYATQGPSSWAWQVVPAEPPPVGEP